MHLVDSNVRNGTAIACLALAAINVRKCTALSVGACVEFNERDKQTVESERWALLFTLR